MLLNKYSPHRFRSLYQAAALTTLAEGGALHLLPDLAASPGGPPAYLCAAGSAAPVQPPAEVLTALTTLSSNHRHRCRMADCNVDRCSDTSTGCNVTSWAVVGTRYLDAKVAEHSLNRLLLRPRDAPSVRCRCSRCGWTFCGTAAWTGH